MSQEPGLPPGWYTDTEDGRRYWTGSTWLTPDASTEPQPAAPVVASVTAPVEKAWPGNKFGKRLATWHREKIMPAWRNIGRRGHLVTYIASSIVVVLVVVLPITLSSSANTKGYTPTAKDYRAFSDEFVTLVAEGSGKDVRTVNLKEFWNQHRANMTSTAKSTCRDLSTKSRAENISSAELAIAIQMDQGTSRKQALIGESSMVAAAYHKVCPQADTRGSQLLAYLSVQAALED